MNLSPLVVTEFGAGFLCQRTRTLRKAFGVHVAPEPRSIRPATEQEARDFFAARGAHREALTHYYETTRDTGD